MPNPIPSNILAETLHELVTTARRIGTYPVNGYMKPLLQEQDLLMLRSNLEHLTRAQARIQRLRDMLQLELDLRYSRERQESLPLDS